MTNTLTAEQIAQGWRLHDGSDKLPITAGTLVQYEDEEFGVNHIGVALYMPDMGDDWTVVKSYRTFSPDLPSPPVSGEAAQKITIKDLNQHFLGQVRMLTMGEMVLTSALRDLYDACVAADEIGELYENIDGDKLDAARLALKGQTPDGRQIGLLSPLANEPVVEVDANDHTMGGSLVFKGSRILVSSIVGWIRQGSSNDDIMAAYPDLTNDQIEGVRGFLDATNEPVGVTISAEMLTFLRGKGPLEGVWFGEPHPTERGMFWWRSRLALSAAIGERG